MIKQRQGKQVNIKLSCTKECSKENNLQETGAIKGLKPTLDIQEILEWSIFDHHIEIYNFYLFILVVK